jgi:hypothetical protein
MLREHKNNNNNKICTSADVLIPLLRSEKRINIQACMTGGNYERLVTEMRGRISRQLRLKTIAQHIMRLLSLYTLQLLWIQ